MKVWQGLFCESVCHTGGILIFEKLSAKQKPCSEKQIYKKQQDTFHVSTVSSATYNSGLFCHFLKGIFH